RSSVAPSWSTPCAARPRRPSCSALRSAPGAMRKDTPTARPEVGPEGLSAVDLQGGPHRRLEGPLDPGVLDRGVLAGEVDGPLGLGDRRLELGELAGRQHRRLAERVGVAHPALGLPVPRVEDLDALPMELLQSP